MRARCGLLKSRRGGLAVLASACAIWFAGAAGRADAAVRQCLRPIVAVVEAPGLEAEARRRVLEAWSMEAGRNGEAFSSWRLAIEKTLVCEKVLTAFRCRARATPCGIAQVPGQQPRGAKPDARPDLKRNKRVIEI